MFEVLFSELVAVDDQRATLFQIGKINFQRGWIHGHQNVWLITWCPNVMTGKIQLKAAHAGKTAGRVEMSLPTIAEVLVNCVPVSCIPSPESPAKRIVTASSSSRCLSMVST